MTDTMAVKPEASRMSKSLSPRTRRVLVRMIITALLIPLSFEVAGVRLTPSLLMMILLFPFLAQQYLKGVVRWRMPDLLFGLYVFWLALTIFLNNPDRFVTFTGQQALATLTAYLAGRVLVLDRQDFISVVLFWVAASVLSVPFALYESLWDDPIILRFIRDYTPFNTFEFNDYESRMGLFRAQVVFTHPIHYGLMGAMIIMPFWMGLSQRLSVTNRVLKAGLVCFATFLSVSSGAVLSVALQIGTLIVYKIAEKIGSAWRVLIISGATLYVVLELLSNKSAFAAISGRLAFSGHTAHYRTLIWEYGSAQVLRTPIFGNGYNYWPRLHWMVSSVDNHWLLLAMVHGLPALLFLVTSLCYAFYVVNKSALRGDEELDRMRLSWTLSLIGLCMSASTVALWGEIQILFMLLFGAGFWLADSRPETAPDPSGAQSSPVSRHLPYSRFSSRTSDNIVTRRKDSSANRGQSYRRSQIHRKTNT